MREPTNRIGVKARKGFKSIREHAWLSGIDWNGILSQKVLPPYTPNKDTDNGHGGDKKNDAFEILEEEFIGDQTLFEYW